MIKFIATILFLFILSGSLQASHLIKVSDQAVERGQNYTLMVESDITTDISSIEISFRYDATMLNILKAIGGDNFILNDATSNIQISLNDNDFTKSTFTIKSNNVKKNASGLVCGIYFQTAGASSKESFVEPISLRINDIVESNLQVKKASITNQIIIKPTELEYISQNFPNPFDTFTQFPIQVIDSSSLQISVYSFTGEQFATIGKDESVIKSTLYDSEGNIILAINGRYSLPKGKYNLFLNPIPYNLPSGSYLIFFKTDREAHTLFFNYIK